MAQFNGNGFYLSIGGTNLSPHVIDIQMSPSANTVDITAGSGATHTKRATALLDTKAKITISYDDTSVADYIQKMKPGEKFTLVIGPEGNTVGKRKHEGDFILVGAPFTVTVKKEPVAFELDFEGADAPITDMYSGGVW